MATKRLNSAERAQRLTEQHRLVQAALDYLSGLVKAESAEPGSESAAHFERMRTEARTHFEQGKLAVLQKYFRDIAAPSLASVKSLVQKLNESLPNVAVACHNPAFSGF